MRPYRHDRSGVTLIFVRSALADAELCAVSKRIPDRQIWTTASALSSSDCQPSRLRIPDRQRRTTASAKADPTKWRLRCHQPVSRRLGFTLLEMLTTVGALVIVLGLMVSLARRVRNASAVELTKDLLRRLDGLMIQYEARHGQLPAIQRFVDAHDADPDEQILHRAALENNRQVLAVLRQDAGVSADAFSGLPDAIYDEAALRDAWGTPIVFMSEMHPAIGMAAKNRRFFFSAGPDHRFLTQDDNLYSYEEGSPGLRGFQ